MRKLLSMLVIVAAGLFLSACNPLEAKKKAGLQVRTNDIPASLFLDGNYLDKTPFIARDLRPGTYTLLIQPDDPKLAPHETTVTLQKGLLSVVIWKPGASPELGGGVIYEMEKLKSKAIAELSLVSIPDGAIASVDGQNKDFAPLLIDNIQPGAHSFEVSLPSYETQSHNVNIEAGYRVNVTVKLAKALPPGTAPASTSTQSATPSAQTSTATASANRPTTIASASATPKPVVTGPRVKILKTNFFNGSQEVLRVRDAASPGGKELGFAPVGNEYPYLGETTNSWYKINFNNQTGWVSSQFAQLIER